jgi:hypothetical protein
VRRLYLRARLGEATELAQRIPRVEQRARVRRVVLARRAVDLGGLLVHRRRIGGPGLGSGGFSISTQTRKTVQAGAFTVMLSASVNGTYARGGVAAGFADYQ